MKALIFAAGLGTRLKPITDTMPKALVPVGGRPLIEHVARKLTASGVDSAVVNVHHFADMIQEWVEAQDIMPMEVSDERELLLETGGGVFHARPYLEGCGRFLIHNVDILSNCDLKWLGTQVSDDAVATLLVSPRKTSRYFLFHPQTMRLVGWTNVSTGEVRMSDLTLSHEDCIAYAFTGIHVMSDRVFALMDQYVKEKGVPSGDAGARFSIVDFYLWAAQTYPLYGVPARELKLLDIGKLDALAPAEAFLGI